MPALRSRSDAVAEPGFTIELAQQADYRFEVRFDDPALPAVITDEAPPLGAGAGPSPARLLAAAVANCLAASLLFSLRKFKNHPEPLRAVATVAMARNAQGRLRIAGIDVDLHLGAPAGELKLRERALEQFEDFCIVTQSVRAGIAVGVRVFDRDGTPLTAGAPERAGDAVPV